MQIQYNTEFYRYMLVKFNCVGVFDKCCIFLKMFRFEKLQEFYLLFSLLIGMRCQIHTEIAKCEEENEQLEYAMCHLKKVCEM